MLHQDKNKQIVFNLSRNKFLTFFVYLFKQVFDLCSHDKFHLSHFGIYFVCSWVFVTFETKLNWNEAKPHSKNQYMGLARF